MTNCWWFFVDWYSLRTNHRILGSLVGSLPATPRQEDQNGLPCHLLPEELRLIVENGIGRAVEYPSLTSLPDKCVELTKNLRTSQELSAINTKYAQDRADLIGKLVVNAILSDDDGSTTEVQELNKEVSKIKSFDISHYTMIHLG